MDASSSRQPPSPPLDPQQIANAESEFDLSDLEQPHSKSYTLPRPGTRERYQQQQPRHRLQLLPRHMQPGQKFMDSQQCHTAPTALSSQIYRSPPMGPYRVSSMPSPTHSVSSIPPASSLVSNQTSQIRKASILEPYMSPQLNHKQKGKATGKKSHFYTPEQETFIAEQVADPDTWELLYGASDMNAVNKPKTGIRSVIVKKFNKKFTTEDAFLDIDDAQLKNKLRNMMACWKTANNVFKKTGNGNLPRSVLMALVLNICHYYKIWEPLASTTLNLNSNDPVQLTVNVSRASAGDSGDDGESNDEDGIVVQLDTDDERSRVRSLEPELPPKESAQPPKKSKRSTVITELIEDMKSNAAEERGIIIQEKAKQQEDSRVTLEYQRQQLDLKRQKLDASQTTASIQEQTDLAILAKAKAEAKKAELEVAIIEAELELVKAKAAAWKVESHSTRPHEVEIDGRKVVVRFLDSPVSSRN